jgi:hypothetical protein
LCSGSCDRRQKLLQLLRENDGRLSAEEFETLAGASAEFNRSGCHGDLGCYFCYDEDGGKNVRKFELVDAEDAFLRLSIMEGKGKDTSLLCLGLVCFFLTLPN